MSGQIDPSKETTLFLKSLQESGIQEVYLDNCGPVVMGQGTPAKTTARSAGKNETVRDAMIALRAETLQCTKCQELSSTRNNVVFGAGTVQTELVFVGEAPGRDEDMQGLPFVGRAGQLLTKIIESIGLTRKDVFICNVLKCRPPGNRQPAPEEVINCRPFLRRQIELMRPRIVCALGNFASRTLLETETGISQLRGRFHDHDGMKIMCTYHPAYLLRNPAEKQKVWQDMKMIRKELSCPST